jgi:hypothetical protein
MSRYFNADFKELFCVHITEPSYVKAGGHSQSNTHPLPLNFFKSLSKISEQNFDGKELRSFDV